MRVPALGGAVEQVVLDGVEPGGADVGVPGEIERAVEHRARSDRAARLDEPWRPPAPPRADSLRDNGSQAHSRTIPIATPSAAAESAGASAPMVSFHPMLPHRTPVSPRTAPAA